MIRTTAIDGEELYITEGGVVFRFPLAGTARILAPGANAYFDITDPDAIADLRYQCKAQVSYQFKSDTPDPQAVVETVESDWATLVALGYSWTTRPGRFEIGKPIESGADRELIAWTDDPLKSIRYAKTYLQQQLKWPTQQGAP